MLYVARDDARYWASEWREADEIIAGLPQKTRAFVEARIREARAALDAAHPDGVEVGELFDLLLQCVLDALSEAERPRRAFAVLANGAYWGSVAAPSEQAAVEAAAEVWGTPGSTEDLRALEVSGAELQAIEAWWEAGAPADECPLTE